MIKLYFYIKKGRIVSRCDCKKKKRIYEGRGFLNLASKADSGPQQGAVLINQVIRSIDWAHSLSTDVLIHTYS